MRQAERDAYQSRAPIRPAHSWYPKQLKSPRGTEAIRFVNCTASWDSGARNRALWTKLRIMLYCLDGDGGTLFGEEDSKIGFPAPNPADSRPLTPQDFLKWCYLESADFDHMAMTNTGTVVCHDWQHIVLFADQEALETGLMILCHIENNGQVMCQGRVWPVLMKDAYMNMTALAKPVEGILDQGIFKAVRSMRQVPAWHWWLSGSLTMLLA